MLALPLYVHGRGENYGSSHRPTASGKPEAKLIQKRGASAIRTQADHSRRERSQIHLNRHERLGNQMHCFHQRATKRGISSKVLCSKMLIRRNWEDLFLKEIKITCSVRQDLNL